MRTSPDWFIQQQVVSGNWRPETIAAEIVGLRRPLTVLRTQRRTNLITYDWHGDRDTFCPPMWWDLAIGSGACGLGCRACFLMLTHRSMRDPWRHVLYDNIADFHVAAEKWLKSRERRPQHTLGVGIDRSDSLLYEGVTAHVRQLAPLFGSKAANPIGCKLILLTKSANARFLADVDPADRRNVVASFSLNPGEVADAWEGKWPDGTRITPSIERRLSAARYAQELGYEVRVRLDPILALEGWEGYYQDFVHRVKRAGVVFRYWTLGTYREKNGALDYWRDRWGLPPMEWEPRNLIKDGTHRHLPAEVRMHIYQAVGSAIRSEFPEARVSLCKETHAVRSALKLCNAECNCLR